MEAIFDNKSNILNAQLRATYDNSILYAIKTTSGFRGRKITLLYDANPAPLGSPTTVGAIHWREKMIEVGGHKKRLADVKKHQGKFFARVRVWRWSEDRTMYRVQYHSGEWTANRGNNNDSEKVQSLASFTVPYRPQLFGKIKPPTLYLSREALSDDEVFLILVFVYSELKRRDKNNSSAAE